MAQAQVEERVPLLGVSPVPGPEPVWQRLSDHYARGGEVSLVQQRVRAPPKLRTANAG